MDTIASVFGSAWVATVLLVSTRLGALWLMTPPWFSVPAPTVVRVLLLVGLSAAIATPLAGGGVWQPRSLGDLAGAFFTECAVGAAMGLGVQMAFAGFALAGRLLDVQVGFGVAQVLDPLTRTHVPVLTSVFTMVGVLLFFIANGHHALLRGLALSLEHFPIGRALAVQDTIRPMLRQAAGLFTLGFALAAPVVACVFLADFALGVVARSLPQVNMLVIGIPVKIVVGLFALSIWAGLLGGAATRLHADIFRGWTVLFQAAPAAQGR